MDPKFKVSDVVIIKRDLERASNGDIPFGICDSMEKHAGKQAVIRDVFPNAKNAKDYPDHPDFDCARYRLDIDEGQWAWSNVMFETKQLDLTTKEEDLLLCCTCF
jgi:hypothetical protein